MATNSPGIRITQAGINAQYAADYQYVFNSDWPSLAIAFEKLIDVPYIDGVTQQTIAHNLGFYPLTMGWSILNGINIGRTFAPSGNLSGPQNDVRMTFDDKNIYLVNTGLYNQVTYTMSIKCYNLDISKSVDYTLPKQPTFKTPYDPSVGIKVVKYGKSAGSADLRDFILHSRAQSPAVLSVVTKVQQTSSGVKYIGYDNPAQYTPWVLAFVGGPGQHTTYEPLAPGSQQAGYLFGILSAANAKANGVAQSRIQPTFLSYPDATFGSLVVLRDPLVVANSIQVTYNG